MDRESCLTVSLSDNIISGLTVLSWTWSSISHLGQGIRFLATPTYLQFHSPQSFSCFYQGHINTSPLNVTRTGALLIARYTNRLDPTEMLYSETHLFCVTLYGLVLEFIYIITLTRNITLSIYYLGQGRLFLTSDREYCLIISPTVLPGTGNTVSYLGQGVLFDYLPYSLTSDREYCLIISPTVLPRTGNTVWLSPLQSYLGPGVLFDYLPYSLTSDREYCLIISPTVLPGTGNTVSYLGQGVLFDYLPYSLTSDREYCLIISPTVLPRTGSTVWLSPLQSYLGQGVLFDYLPYSLTWDREYCLIISPTVLPRTGNTVWLSPLVLPGTGNTVWLSPLQSYLGQGVLFDYLPYSLTSDREYCLIISPSLTSDREYCLIISPTVLPRTGNTVWLSPLVLPRTGNTVWLSPLQYYLGQGILFDYLPYSLTSDREYCLIISPTVLPRTGNTVWLSPLVLPRTGNTVWLSPLQSSLGQGILFDYLPYSLTSDREYCLIICSLGTPHNACTSAHIVPVRSFPYLQANAAGSAPGSRSTLRAETKQIRKVAVADPWFPKERAPKPRE